MQRQSEGYLDYVALYQSPDGEVHVFRAKPKRAARRGRVAPPIIDCRPKPGNVQKAQRLDEPYVWLGHVFANAGDWLVWDARGVSAVMTNEEFRSAFDLV